jgi:antitoxin HicB
MKRDLKYYLRLKYPILLTESEDNGVPYIEAEIPELPGCGSYGVSRTEALERLNKAKRNWIKARLKRNLPIPEPVSEEDFSGKFLLRITPELHRLLAKGARDECLSLNQYIRKILETNVVIDTVLEKMKSLEQEITRIRRVIEIESGIFLASLSSNNVYMNGPRIGITTEEDQSCRYKKLMASAGIPEEGLTS